MDECELCKKLVGPPVSFTIEFLKGGNTIHVFESFGNLCRGCEDELMGRVHSSIKEECYHLGKSR